MKKAFFGGLVLLLVAGAPGLPQTLEVSPENAGDILLYPDQAGQEVSFSVTGGAAVEVKGLNFYIQVADGGPEAAAVIPGLVGKDGPSIQSIDLLTGTIFVDNNDGQYDPPDPWPQQTEALIATIPPGWSEDDPYLPDPNPPVYAEGLIATVAFDTTGFTADSQYHPWDLMLTDVLDMVDTSFAGLPDTVSTNITNGTISIARVLNSDKNGFWNTGGTWEGGGPPPEERTIAVVGPHRVVLDQVGGQPGDALAVTVAHADGALAVNPDFTLTVVDDLKVSAGTLEVGSTGLVDVGRDLSIAGEYLCKFGPSDAGQIQVAGEAGLEPGSSLAMEATSDWTTVDRSSTWAEHELAIIAGAEAVAGSFANVPGPTLEELHLGYGLFFDGVGDDGTDVTAEVFQPIAGDANADRKVNLDDLGDVLVNWDPLGTTNDWLHADFNFDGAVNLDDLGDVLVNWSPLGYTGGGSMAMASLSPASVPEPGTLALLSMGAVSALIFVWRKRLPKNRQL